ncbi:MAG: DUF3788 domain-containing protein [Bacteroidia bacterium]
MKSIFTDKKKKPDEADLKEALGSNYTFWKTIAAFTRQSYPSAKEEWNYSSEKYGWSFRISDKRRVLIYLLPRNNFFKTAFVFGQKATDEILKSDVSDSIKKELNAAKVYAEGRGIRLEVKDKTLISDIKKLISIKVKI